ncbi:hypothetical protein O6H91_09G037900 [Diphasiastrum complanatum]|uniref:Uncharacterized protein n=1 Tax=Diphasiastrum complanatum TaxID=34168 RepID=A0ACC2CN34_DIPCM|nr:hypothetical protein O6H91_09G037900 [Diphasiastrum complanatum]
MERSGTWFKFSGAPLCYLMIVSASLLVRAASVNSQYLIGIGSYDITGPAADVNMMGYAMSQQNAAGIHFRLRSRAFIIAEAATSSSETKRIAYVNLDACMGSQAVTLAVLSRLNQRYGDLYNERNVAISGIHTHSGPGGYLQYVIYIITALGFVRQSFDALVDGIETSIVQAHENLRPGSIYLNKDVLFDANINRSPSAYLNNPLAERNRYQYDVDKDMLLLKFVDGTGAAIGALNWFAVHGTSMNNSNLLISGDNKGAASRFMEDWFANGQKKSSLIREGRAADVKVSNSKSTGGSSNTKVSSERNRLRSSVTTTQSTPFVAAFAQTSSGDVSPNTLGAFCTDKGLPCDFNHSTCDGLNELCIARGPGYPDMFLSTKIIAERQFQKAVDLFENAQVKLSGRIDYRQTYLNITGVTVDLSSSATTSLPNMTTCPAALGFSFAAGTTDGPGAFDFKQGDNQGNLFWRLVGSALKPPTPQQISCQHPKPILLDAGEITVPSPWALLSRSRFFNLASLSYSAFQETEFTTMAGRRLREAITATLVERGYSTNIQVVISGLTNTYSQYVTTFEEYQVQRYEGASTLYGPYTLNAYIQEMKRLAVALAEGSSVDPGLTPPYLVDRLVGFLPGVIADSTPLGINFGDVKQDVPQNARYTAGDVVEAVFWSACPRNDLFTNATFSSVEQQSTNGNWIPVYDDDDWELRFLWSRPFFLSPQSFATIRWEIPTMAAPGVYRLRHFGAAKPLIGSSLSYFSGTSSTFTVS